jgi:hypothetical protein
MSHEFSEGIDVHAVDDRLGAEVVPQTVQRHVTGQPGSIA